MLNIKNPETNELARELAELTGENLTEAITIAVRERLERLRRKKNQQDLSARILAIGRDAASRMREPYKSMDPDEFLYDDRGLPK